MIRKDDLEERNEASDGCRGRSRLTRALPCLALGAWLGLTPGSAAAGEADVVAAVAQCTSESICRFRVTVRHADEGWNHYVTRWQVLTPDGAVLATRVLRHPHVEEQPFTRGLTGVHVPAEVDRVRIRAVDSVHGLGGEEVTVTLER